MSSTEVPPTSKYETDFEALVQAGQWLSHINLRRHRGNDQVRADVQAARLAVTKAYDTLLEVDGAEMQAAWAPILAGMKKASTESSSRPGD